MNKNQSMSSKVFMKNFWQKGCFSFLITLTLAAPFQSVRASEGETVSTLSPYVALQDSKKTHLERMDLLEMMALEYKQATPEQQKGLPSLYRTAYRALLLKNEDAVLELSYEFKGLNASIPGDKLLALELLAPYMQTAKTQAFKAFLQKRTLHNAQEFLNLADTPESQAVANMCMAEVYYAKNDAVKAVMFATLSLAYNFSDEREEQAKFYLTGQKNSDISLRAEKNDIITHLLKKMKHVYTPQGFHRYYTMTSVLSLLPEFPYSSEALAKKTAEPIHICIGFDSNYTYHGAVTILSAMLSADPSTSYVFHVPEDPEGTSPITEAQQKKFVELAAMYPEGRFKVEFEEFDLSLVPENVLSKQVGRWPRSIYFKMYIPQFYSAQDKFMWLDSDLIVRRDLTEFYSQDMQGNLMLGVRDVDAETHLARLGLKKDDAYINTGVVLFDNKSLRKPENKALLDNCIIANIEDPEFLQFPEQDIFAVAFKNQILQKGAQFFLRKKYYFPDSHWNFNYRHSWISRWEKVHDHFAYIFHMSGRSQKPWNQKYSPTLWNLYPRSNDGVINLYWALRDMGPWPSRSTL